MKIYLAGPDVFREDAIKRGKYLKQLCEVRGFEGLFPLDNEVSPMISKFNMAQTIYEANMKMIQECDFVIANLDPFRGPSVDPGTAFEIGAGRALGKQVYGYYNVPSLSISPYKDRVSVSETVNSRYPIIEDFGLKDNLMIILGCDAVFNTFQDALDHAASTKKLVEGVLEDL